MYFILCLVLRSFSEVLCFALRSFSEVVHETRLRPPVADYGQGKKESLVAVLLFFDMGIRRSNPHASKSICLLPAQNKTAHLSSFVLSARERIRTSMGHNARCHLKAVRLASFATRAYIFSSKTRSKNCCACRSGELLLPLKCSFAFQPNRAYLLFVSIALLILSFLRERHITFLS